MSFRKLLFRWRRWRATRRHRPGTEMGVTHVVLRDFTSLLDTTLLSHYRPSIGMTITIDGGCHHFGELTYRFSEAIATIREGNFVKPAQNKFDKARRQRLDDYLVDETDRPLTIEETLSILTKNAQDYYEAMENIKDENRATYYRRQYSRLNQEVLELTNALIKVMDHG